MPYVYKTYKVENGHRGHIFRVEVQRALSDQDEQWLVAFGVPSVPMMYSGVFDNASDACAHALSLTEEAYNSAAVFGPLMITITDGDRS